MTARQKINGGCSSVGRVPDCDSGCRGFESHLPPQDTKALLVHSRAFSYISVPPNPRRYWVCVVPRRLSPRLSESLPFLSIP